MGQDGAAMSPGVIYGTEDFKSRKEKYQVIDRDVLENCDICIIGSGASGRYWQRSSVMRKICGLVGKRWIL